MPDKKNSAQGEIVTFYSFKGGVGRTMALANIAFIAAKNGLKVLVMDWDLEAPGLLYYFRGLLDPIATKNVNQAPGVLNMLWEWNSRASSTANDEETSKLLGEMESGKLFRKCVCAIGDEGFTSPGSIDFMGAGAAKVENPDALPYEDALAKFSWPHFYEKAFGGVLIDGLRKWAKTNYDLVLVDSRTGLADVAGLCTMQLPDTAALCFILNRQNIEGVAKVSGAIRSQRKEKVKVRAIPMRVARQETPEESDARARAIDQLTSIGGFSSEAAQEDLRILAVPTDAGIPFYEVLAPFSPTAASNPALDPLTLIYVQLANELIDENFLPPSISESQAKLVRARLQPRQATIDYIKKLSSAEPGRALAEIQRLLVSAQEEMYGGQVQDVDYLAALVDAVLSVDDGRTDKAAIGLKSQAADLVRELYSTDQETWRTLLINTLEKLAKDYILTGQMQAHLSLLEEIDVLLASIQTNTTQLQRLHYRRQAAWSYLSLNQEEAGLQTIREIEALLQAFDCDEARPSSKQQEQLLAAEIDAHLARASIHKVKLEFENCLEELRKAVNKAEASVAYSSSHEIRSLAAEGHWQIADTYYRNEEKDEAAQHAVRTVQIEPLKAYWHFVDLAKFVIEATNPAPFVEDFLRYLFHGEDPSIEQLLASHFGHSPGTTSTFLRACASLIKILEPLDSGKARTVAPLMAAVELAVKTLLRRRHAITPQTMESIDEGFSKLKQKMNSVGVVWRSAT